MSSYYSVVRYVPDPVADERINVGVVVFGSDYFRHQVPGEVAASP